MTVNFNNTYKDFYKVIGADTKNMTTPVLGNAVKSPAEPVSASVRVGDVKENNPTNKKKIFGIIGVSVGSVTLLTILVLSLLSKGFSAGLAKKISLFSDKLKSSLYELTAESKKLTPSQKLKLQAIKVIQPAADSLKAVSNVTAVKDSLAQKLLNKMHMSPVVESINKVFKKIVLKTKNDSYHYAELAMVDFCNKLRNTKNPELIKKAQEIETQYFKHFSSAVHISRTEQAWKNMKNLHQEVYDTLFKDYGLFKNLKKYTSYITTDKVSENKNILEHQLKSAKSLISNSLDDVYMSIKNALYQIKLDVDPKNKEAVSVIKELSEKIETYRTIEKTMGAAKESTARAQVFKDITIGLNTLTALCTKNPNFKTLQNNVRAMGNMLSENATKKGLAQEVLTEVKHLYGKKSKEYTELKSALLKMNEKLNKAINYESSSFDKMAELRVGSAPTDIVGILFPAAIAAFLVANSKDKDERISNTLLKGIPLLGGIGAAFYGNTRQFTGAKNLALGLSTSFILNRIGAQVDEAYKKYSEKQTILKKAFESITMQQSNASNGKTE